MFRTLYSKLAIALVLVLLLVGGLSVGTNWFLGKQYTDLVVQTFNKDLASNLINEKNLIQSGELSDTMLKQLLAEYMTINPNIEIYIIDTVGKILSFSAPKDKVVRKNVSLDPIKIFLENEEYQPVLGDDPRSLERGKAFSVAPINTNDGMFGYLYIVLRGEAYDAVDQLLQRQYLHTLGQRVLIMSLLVGLVAGLLILWTVTRRLTRLSKRVENFQSQIEQPPSFTNSPSLKHGDEIFKLEQKFTAMAARIKHQIESLEDNDEKRRNLVANISHDLRTPLASVLGYLEILQSRGDQISPLQRASYLDIAIQNTNRLAVLIEELFELAKLEAGGVIAGKEPFDVVDLVQDVVQQQKIGADKKGVVLEVTSCPQVPRVLGDISLIQRVLENLIANAIHFVKRGDKVVVRLEKDEAQVKVAIWDGGRPIEEYEIDRLFDRFYQGKQSDNVELGAGLGLSIARQIMLLHNSVIDVCNKKSGGKEFSFVLQVI